MKNICFYMRLHYSSIANQIVLKIPLIIQNLSSVQEAITTNSNLSLAIEFPGGPGCLPRNHLKTRFFGKSGLNFEIHTSHVRRSMTLA